MAKHSVSPDSLLELGQLYAEKGDFEKALVHLASAEAVFEKSKNYPDYLKCINLRLRIYAEMENDEAVTEIKEKLQDLVIRQSVKLSAKTYYTLGLCASFKGQQKLAVEHLEKSLLLGTESDHKEDICYAINGLAIVYTRLGELDLALEQIQKLKVFFHLLQLPELELSSLIMRGQILRERGQTDEALKVLWECYDILKDQKNLYMHVNLLYAMGMTYLQAGRRKRARFYLTLAKRSVDPKNLRRLARLIDVKLEEVGVHEGSKYDLVFELEKNSVVERDKGRVDFKNRFILLELLRLFMQHPGEVYSKESLAKEVWNQEYDPTIHDNKIYVTIKRLRKLIEPDFEKPKYIFRSKDGYFFNERAKVYIEN